MKNSINLVAVIFAISVVSQTLANTNASLFVKCKEPEGKIKTLFSMIEDPMVSSESILTFVAENTLAADARSLSCETPLYASIRTRRSDLFNALYARQNYPDPNRSASKEMVLRHPLKKGYTAYQESLLAGHKAQYALFRNPQSYTLYEYAVLVGTTQIVDTLKKNKGSWSVTKFNGLNEIMAAAASNDLEKLRYFLSQPDANVNAERASSESSYGGETALFYAAAGANSELIDELITAGAHINKNPRADGVSYLHLVVANPNVTQDMLRKFLALGFRIDARVRGPKKSAMGINVNGATPFLNSASRGSPEILAELLRAGAKIDDYDDSGRNAFLLASHFNSLESLKALVQAGVDVHARDSGGDNALLSEVNYIFAGRLAVLRYFLDLGVELNVHGYAGFTPLMYAVYHQHHEDSAEYLTTLLEAGAEINAFNLNGGTALSVAASVGTADLVKLLVQYGADVNAQKELRYDNEVIEMETALMAAVRANKDHGNEVVMALLDAGANPRLKDNNGYTAYDYRIQREVNGYLPPSPEVMARLRQ